jgi:hypothetical protein
MAVDKDAAEEALVGRKKVEFLEGKGVGFALWIREADTQKECQDARTDCEDKVFANVGEESVVDVRREFRRQSRSIGVEYGEVDGIEVGWDEG